MCKKKNRSIVKEKNRTVAHPVRVYAFICICIYICTKHFLGLRISLDSLSSEEAVADNAIHGVPWKSRR